MSGSKARTLVSEVLHFWFGTGVPSYAPSRLTLWYGGEPTDDATIRDRFAHHVEAAAAGEYDAEIIGDAESELALIILLDQFTRVIHRGTPRAFENDAKAVSVCLSGIEAHRDLSLHPVHRSFYYHPLMHSEDPSVQKVSREKFAQVAAELQNEQLKFFADRHAEIVERFGRFPHRNHILGRQSTPEEIEFLKTPNSSF
jgi:uncharacterized protein (DUF924 family)